MAYTEYRYALILSKLNKLKEAEDKFEKAIEITTQMGMISTTLNCYHDYSITLEKQRKYQKALEFERKFNVLKDSLNKKNEVSLDVHLKSIFDLDKKEIENKYLVEKLKLERADLQKSYVLVVAIIFLLVILVVFMFYMQKNNRQNKYYNIRLNAQKQEIEKQNNSLNDMVKRLDSLVRVRTLQLEKQNEQLKEYAFTNAHILRAPVATILGLIYLIKNKEPYRSDEIIAKLDKTTNNLNDTVRDIKRKLEEEM